MKTLQNAITIATAANSTLRGMLVTPENLQPQNPAILLLHGWMSDMHGYIPRAAALAAHGYICLTFDLRGHGTSDGTLSEVTAQGSLQDAVAAYDFLASLAAVNPSSMSVVGSSYGGYLAALLTAQRPVAALALRSPALYRDDMFATPKVQEMRSTLQAYRQLPLGVADNYALHALSTYTNPVLLIEAEKDEQIPHQTLENYRKAINPKAAVTNVLLAHADHGLTKPEWKQQFLALLVDWFVHNGVGNL